MKKIIALFMAIIIIACGLTSCNHQHNFGEWKVLKQASCTENGQEARYCYCGEKQAETIYATRHNYVNGVCIFCNEEKGSHICYHENVYFTSAVSPTCTKNGYTEGKYCDDCGITLINPTVLKAGHNFENGICTKCGSESNFLLMEAEYTYMDDVVGAGISNNNSGLSMIYGDGTDARKNLWSNGYYVGYTHNDQTVLEFVFNASKDSTATITFALGCELENMVLIAGENLNITVNGEEQFFNWSVTCSEMDEAKFANYTLNNVQLKEGENKIAISVLAVPGNPARGPLVDCVTVVAADAELSWTAHEDNPYRRDTEI